MTASERALDDLLQLPDLGERLCLGNCATRPSSTSGSANSSAATIMNDAYRILFELRNELAMAVEIDGRTGLQNHLTLVQWSISKRARGGCTHIHAEDWPQIRTLFGLRNGPTGWPLRRSCSWTGDPE